MKVVKAVRDLYNSAVSRYQRLEGEVKELLKPRVEEHDWFFLSRVKQLESFALKLETGRVPDPLNLEDFYACTIVVPTMGKIKVAENLVRKLFDLSYRRPKNDAITHKAASSFVFDDLRLYVARRPPASGLHPDLDGLVFEVQVKTILQHAWSVATHVTDPTPNFGPLIRRVLWGGGRSGGRRPAPHTDQKKKSTSRVVGAVELWASL